ncbi:6389_t:CDS:2, partial [Racocetra persica]
MNTSRQTTDHEVAELAEVRVNDCLLELRKITKIDVRQITDRQREKAFASSIEQKD